MSKRLSVAGATSRIYHDLVDSKKKEYRKYRRGGSKLKKMVQKRQISRFVKAKRQQELRGSS